MTKITFSVAITSRGSLISIRKLLDNVKDTETSFPFTIAQMVELTQN